MVEGSIPITTLAAASFKVSAELGLWVCSNENMDAAFRWL